MGGGAIGGGGAGGAISSRPGSGGAPSLTVTDSRFIGNQPQTGVSSAARRRERRRRRAWRRHRGPGRHHDDLEDDLQRQPRGRRRGRRHRARGPGPGGAGGVGGAIYAGAGATTITTSTFAANRAGAGGLTGGNSVGARQGRRRRRPVRRPNGTADVEYSTFSGNLRGPASFADAANGVAGGRVTGSILADPAPACQNVAAGPLMSVTLPGDAGCPGPRLEGDPRLGPLAANGGPTLTLLPGPGSAAIDAWPGRPARPPTSAACRAPGWAAATRVRSRSSPEPQARRRRAPPPRHRPPDASRGCACVRPRSAPPAPAAASASRPRPWPSGPRSAPRSPTASTAPHGSPSRSASPSKAGGWASAACGRPLPDPGLAAARAGKRSRAASPSRGRPARTASASPAACAARSSLRGRTPSSPSCPGLLAAAGRPPPGHSASCADRPESGLGAPGRSRQPERGFEPLTCRLQGVRQTPREALDQNDLTAVDRSRDAARNGPAHVRAAAPGATVDLMGPKAGRSRGASGPELRREGPVVGLRRRASGTPWRSGRSDDAAASAHRAARGRAATLVGHAGRRAGSPARLKAT